MCAAATNGKPVEIEDLEEDGRVILRLRGELDIAGVPTLDRRVRDACGSASRGLRIDLSQLDFVDSSGIASIVLASSLCEQRGLDFELVRGPEAVQRLFVLTGLADVLPFAD